MSSGVDRIVRARRGLGIFALALVVTTAPLQLMLLHRGRPIHEQPLLVAAIMWAPALASLVARLVLREGLSDVSFRLPARGRARALLTAWFYPLAVCALAYVPAWVSGLASFEAPTRVMDIALSGPAPLRLAVRVAASLTVGVLSTVPFVAGEELGWRGYMLTRLVDARVSRPVLISGLVWGIWHAPLVFSGVYAQVPYPRAQTVLFFVNIVSSGYLVARLRLESGSIWPPILLHAAWNSVLGSFDRSTKGDAATLWTGEMGLLVAVANVIVIALLVRGEWSARRDPRAEPLPLTVPR